MLSASLTKADIEAVLKKSDALPPWKLICRRLLAASVMLLILGAAIVVKVMVKLPEVNGNIREDEGSNYTLYSNVSTSNTFTTTPSIVFVTDS